MLIFSENRVILALVVLSQYTHATDRQTDDDDIMTIAELSQPIATFDKN